MARRQGGAVVSKHTHCRWQLDKGSWISSDVKDENRCVWVLESDYLNMKEKLEAEIKRLTKAGDLLCRMAGNNQVINRHWKTAKKGVQS